MKNKNVYAILLALVISVISMSGAMAGKNIEGVDRAELVQALYKRAKVQGHGWMARGPSELSLEEAQSLVGQYLDYLHGKAMKIQIPSETDGNEIETWLYNRDNGSNAAEEIVDMLLKG